MTMKGVPVKSIKFGLEKRQKGVFENVDPKRTYKIQCLIGEQITENSGVFRGHSEAVVVPRDAYDVVKTIVTIVFVILFVVFGICGLIIMFKFPEFFDIFFPSYVRISTCIRNRNRDYEPETQGLLHKPSQQQTGNSESLLQLWVCDVCQASNSPSLQTCSTCHQPRIAQNSILHPGEVGIDLTTLHRREKSKSHRNGHSKRRRNPPAKKSSPSPTPAPLSPTANRVDRVDRVDRVEKADRVQRVEKVEEYFKTNNIMCRKEVKVETEVPQRNVEALENEEVRRNNCK